jgi:hypothetical protein
MAAATPKSIGSKIYLLTENKLDAAPTRPIIHIAWLHFNRAEYCDPEYPGLSDQETGPASSRALMSFKASRSDEKIFFS